MTYKRVEQAQVTILEHHEDQAHYTLEVRRDSACIIGPRVIPDHVAMKCIDAFGFKKVS